MTIRILTEPLPRLKKRETIRQYFTRPLKVLRSLLLKALKPSKMINRAMIRVARGTITREAESLRYMLLSW
jgi:hypothetical protein